MSQVEKNYVPLLECKIFNKKCTTSYFSGAQGKQMGAERWPLPRRAKRRAPGASSRRPRRTVAGLLSEGTAHPPFPRVRVLPNGRKPNDRQGPATPLEEGNSSPPPTGVTFRSPDRATPRGQHQRKSTCQEVCPSLPTRSPGPGLSRGFAVGSIKRSEHLGPTPSGWRHECVFGGPCG